MAFRFCHRGVSILKCSTLCNRFRVLGCRSQNYWIHVSINNTLMWKLKPAIVTKLPQSQFSTYPPHTIIKLPNLSPTMETGNIVSWAKNEGDEVAEGDLLAEIETDKATMLFEASDSGFLAKIMAQNGAKDIPVGTPLCIMVEDASTIPQFKDYKVESAPPKSEVAATTSIPQSLPSTSKPAQSVTPVPDRSGTRTFASPLARSIASEKGIDLDKLFSLKSGTGMHGMLRSIDLKDVSSDLNQPQTSGQFTDIAASNMRIVIAKRLAHSKQTIPHYSLTTDIFLDELIRVRAHINSSLAKSSRRDDSTAAKISFNDIFIKAISIACLKIPECNSSWQNEFIRQYNTVDVSVAVATPSGLITPIIFGVEKKGLMEINQEMKELIEKARANKLKPQEFQGGTFTISNLGMFGINSFSAIINEPQACILAVGQPRSSFVPDDQKESGFRSANVLSVTLCCDHRVVDGAVGAKWVGEFKSLLENPSLMLV